MPCKYMSTSVLPLEKGKNIHYNLNMKKIYCPHCGALIRGYKPERCPTCNVKLAYVTDSYLEKKSTIRVAKKAEPKKK